MDVEVGDRDLDRDEAALGVEDGVGVLELEDRFGEEVVEHRRDDDIEEWLSDLLGTSLGLLDVIVTAVLDHVLAEPVFELEDPYPILDAAGGLIPVKVPVADLDVHVTDDEMVVEANVGP